MTGAALDCSHRLSALDWTGELVGFLATERLQLRKLPRVDLEVREQAMCTDPDLIVRGNWDAEPLRCLLSREPGPRESRGCR